MKQDKKTLYEFLHKMQSHIDYNQLQFPEEERRKNFYLFGICKELIKRSDEEILKEIDYRFYENASRPRLGGEIDRYDDETIRQYSKDMSESFISIKGEDLQ